MKECILNNIIGPGDIKSLNARERETLCREIRERLVEVVSCNGGHLASNLGVVEVSKALQHRENMLMLVKQINYDAFPAHIKADFEVAASAGNILLLKEIPK
jgi:hypothetical protein